MAVSLTKRVENLINALGGDPKPTYIEIRNLLVEFRASFERLKDGQAFLEATGQIETLEAKARDLEAQLQKADSEIKRLREEEKKRQQKEDDIPASQLRILHALPPPSKTGWAAYEIASRLQIAVDEGDFHIKKLSEKNLIKSGIYAHGNPMWTRSDAGNQRVIALRLAQEEPVNLSRDEKEILLMIHSCRETGVGENFIFEQIGPRLEKRSREQFKLSLANLYCLGFISAASELDMPSYGMGEPIFIEQSGSRYLSENNLLP